METNILGESRIECIHAMTPDETRLININWNQLDKYIELINHDMKMTILNNISQEFMENYIETAVRYKYIQVSIFILWGSWNR